MKVIVERAALVKMMASLKTVRGSGQKADKFARLWACAGRVFVEANDVTAGVEALVLQDGSCYVPRERFLKLVQSFTPKANVTIEADAQTFRIESMTMDSVDYSSVGVPPAKFDVFAVADASWMTESALKTYGLKDVAPVPSSKPQSVPPKPAPPAVPSVPASPPKPSVAAATVVASEVTTKKRKATNELQCLILGVISTLLILFVWNKYREGCQPTVSIEPNGKMILYHGNFF